VTGACCGGLGRRQFLERAAAAGALAAAAPASRASATEGDYEAMLLGCIDPRMVEPYFKYMAGRDLTGEYSQFIIAGAAIAVVARRFVTWRPAFWDNLATTVELHHIKRLVVLDHRDCGAAKIAFGEPAIATPEKETVTHREALDRLREQVKKRQPHLEIETGLMALDGTVEFFR
jgi:carbonic anhydrase